MEEDDDDHGSVYLRHNLGFASAKIMPDECNDEKASSFVSTSKSSGHTDENTSHSLNISSSPRTDDSTKSSTFGEFTIPASNEDMDTSAENVINFEALAAKVVAAKECYYKLKYISLPALHSLHRSTNYAHFCGKQEKSLITCFNSLPSIHYVISNFNSDQLTCINDILTGCFFGFPSSNKGWDRLPCLFHGGNILLRSKSLDSLFGDDIFVSYKLNYVRSSSLSDLPHLGFTSAFANFCLESRTDFSKKISAGITPDAKQWNDCDYPACDYAKQRNDCDYPTCDYLARDYPACDYTCKTCDYTCKSAYEEKEVEDQFYDMDAVETISLAWTSERDGTSLTGESQASNASQCSEDSVNDSGVLISDSECEHLDITIHGTETFL